jgi:hypothetical protein
MPFPIPRDFRRTYLRDAEILRPGVYFPDKMVL